MDTQQARQLLQKYNSGECTEPEKALVEDSLLAFNEQDIELSQERLDEIAAEVYARLPVPRTQEAGFLFEKDIVTHLNSYKGKSFDGIPWLLDTDLAEPFKKYLRF